MRNTKYVPNTCTKSLVSVNTSRFVSAKKLCFDKLSKMDQLNSTDVTSRINEKLWISYNKQATAGTTRRPRISISRLRHQLNIQQDELS